MMIEYPDVEERIEALSRLIGVEKSIYFQVEGHEKVFQYAMKTLKEKQMLRRQQFIL